MERRLHCVDRRAGSRASWRSCNGLVTMLLLRASCFHLRLAQLYREHLQ